jgi:hypothetical protein
VAIAGRDLRRAELEGLRVVHLGRWTSALVHDVAIRRRWVEPRWRIVVEDALAYRRAAPSARAYRRHPGRRRQDAADFVSSVIDAGNALPGDARSAFGK